MRTRYTMSRSVSSGTLAIALAALACAAVARAAGLWVNLSGSMPIGIYRTVRGPIVRGSIVVACLPESIAVFARERGYLGRGSCPGDTQCVGKPVAAVQGDTVEVGPEGARVNGTLVVGSRQLERDSRGRGLRVYRLRSTTLHVGELLLVATRDPRSFDGRYFGPLAVADIRSVVRPLWQNSGH
jgi:conjugative transfer signal peptidase TraF